MESVKIIDLIDVLIEHFAKMYNKKEEKIQIREIGLFAGEKMYEELYNRDEKRMETSHPQILTALSAAVDRNYVERQIEVIMRLVHERDRESLLSANIS